VLVMISSISVAICNRFHAIKANSDYNNHFLEVTFFDTRVRRPPQT